MNQITKLAYLVRQAFRSEIFGFIQGHDYLTANDLKQLSSLVGKSDPTIILEYERVFSKTVGDGSSLAFASGRMAFYSLMKVLGVTEGDEVILPAFTCAVMPNAVLKIGAIPVYADIDPYTFGSDALSIDKVISKRTKLIVAQHSFGIPCNIDEIVKLAKRRGIYLVEDCALTFDSKYKGVRVGNWGDAAIFSTDHSKPLNTIIGGLLYTNNPSLYKKCMDYSSSLPDLALDHQYRLYKQLIRETYCYSPKNYAFTRLFNVAWAKFQKIVGNNKTIFLENDCTNYTDIKSAYPYPARLPVFLGKLGLLELEHWRIEKEIRKVVLGNLIEACSQCLQIKNSLLIYEDCDRDISPLRLVFSTSDGGTLFKRLEKIIDTSWIWFQQPVIGAKNGVGSMGYIANSCPIAENICLNIFNIPCALTVEQASILSREIKKAINN